MCAVFQVCRYHMIALCDEIQVKRCTVSRAANVVNMNFSNVSYCVPHRRKMGLDQHEGV